MQHQLAPLPKWCIIMLLALCPPVGYYYAVLYHRTWVKRHWWFTVLVVLYFVALVVGVVLSGFRR